MISFLYKLNFSKISGNCFHISLRFLEFAFISLRFLKLAFISLRLSKISISLRFWCDPNFGTRQVFSYLCYAAICGLFVNNLPDINPEYLIGVTPYHFAAMNGHVAIWELFLNHLEDKNPASQVDKAFTPFHYAAQNGHFETCQLFLEKLENKNPTCQYGITPFYLASEKGHFEICRLMIDNIHSKNLETKLKNIGSLSGRTSLHAAAENGHLKVYKLLLENLKNKTPEDDYGKTPFDLAKGPFLYYVRVFWDFFEPPTDLCKDIFTT